MENKIVFVCRNTPKSHPLLSAYIDFCRRKITSKVDVISCYKINDIRKIEKSSVLLTEDPISIFFCILFSKSKKNIFLSFEMFEFQMKNVNLKSIVRNTIFFFLHRLALRKACYIVFPSVIRRNYYTDKIGHLKFKSSVLRNKFLPPVQETIESCKRELYWSFKDFKKSKEKIVVYGGKAHSQEFFLEMINVIEAAPNIGFVFFISNLNGELFSEISCLKNVMIHRTIDHYEYLNILQECDIGMLLYGDEPKNVKMCAPVKIYEYMFYGLSIVANKNYGLIKAEENINFFDDMDGFLSLIRSLKCNKKLYLNEEWSFEKEVEVDFPLIVDRVNRINT